MNNRVANVVPPNDGVSATEQVAEAAAREFGVYGADGVIPLSTGVVGWYAV